MTESITVNRDELMENYQYELTRLLDYVAKTAIAIRMHSAYSKAGRRHRVHEQVDLFWLSDSLHNFSYLASAIAAGRSAVVVAECDLHIDTYERYRMGDTRFSSKAAFARAREHGVVLDEAIAIFRDIRAKALTIS